MSKEYYKRKIAALEERVKELVKSKGEYRSYSINNEERCNPDLITNEEYGMEEGDPEYSKKEEQEFINYKNQPLLEHLSKYDYRFPTDIFPKAIIEHVMDARQCLNYPESFYMTGILMAFSTAIGTKFIAEITPGKQSTASLMTVLVGHPAINKTSPLQAAIKPLLDYEIDLLKQYKKELEHYHSLKADDKRGIPEPTIKRLVTTDATTSALTMLIGKNKHGMLAFTDEFAGFMKAMNMYRKGNDEEFWLQVFSGVDIRKDRMDRQEIITNVFISLTGTIQTEVLLEMIGSNPANNGFFDRLLYVLVDDEVDTRWSDKALNLEYRDKYYKLLRTVLDIPIALDKDGNVVSKVLSYTQKAIEKLIQWQHSNVNFCKRVNDALLTGIARKLEIYAGRFALIIAIMDYAEKSPKLLIHDNSKIVIRETHVDSAVKLCAYFLNTAMRLLAILPEKNYLKKTSKKFQQFYDALPSRFDTATAYEIAGELNIRERTMFNFLKSEYIKKISHAQYEKRYYKAG